MNGPDPACTGGENFSLRDILLRGRKLDLQGRTRFFSEWIGARAHHGESLYLRVMTSMADREVEVVDAFGIRRRMLMFGSNNYLGLTSHPYVRQKVKEAVDRYGAGIGGPPLLNGYSILHRELEERLSAMKGKEDTVVFQSGYGANVGLVSSLVGKHDTVLYDIYSHASFLDGIRMADATAVRFMHNDVAELEALLEATPHPAGTDVFVAAEGVYSMDGTIAPLDRIVPLAHRHGALVVIDDAHGTGVLGPAGAGTAEHFGVDADIVMGTMSKAFGAVGGFVSTSKPIADYLRFFGRSYMFSSSAPPAVLAAVLAGLDVLEREPEVLERLHANVAYLARGLARLGFDVHPQTAIIPLPVPEGVNIRRAAYDFHRAGIFLNSVEYPAVPTSQQRFRISMMATHTEADIDRLLEVVADVWATFEEAPREAARP